MQTTKFWFLPLAVLAAVLTFSFDDAPHPLPAAPDLVVIDPGHGGKDPGAIGVTKSYEKTIALGISKKVADLINKNVNGMNAHLTRSDDRFLGLYERAKIANDKDAALFISIHCNSSSNQTANGSETFAMGLHKTAGNLELMKRENSSILLEEDHHEKYDGFDPKSEEATIIFKLQQHAYLKQSLHLAGHVEKQMKLQTKRVSRGVKQAGFLVLWKTTMPSVLVEAGFLSHANEEKFLKSEAGQDHVAKAIYRAILDYRAEL